MNARIANRPVRARVYDIRDANITLPPEVLVDTNAWLCTQYSRFSLPSVRPETPDYSDFIARCLNENCVLRRSSFTLPEMSHIIEKEEVGFSNANSGRRISVKDSRYDIRLRRKVLVEIVTTWRGVESASQASPGLNITAGTPTVMLRDIGQYKLDGYDLFLLQEARATGTLAVLTHDFDYLSVPDLCVFTANAAGIDAARQAGRLRTIW
ncbi:hypothetical protein AB4076_07120 [Dyella sp. 2RAF44]